eukprot:TRINITY_DN3493_c0_g1_i1.p1 TRINITY_DN3493_c0_g1~~TRINITY_DN3493_c0_g1_i1.p1  ORF type:complete len:250 (+),score=44.78 TRINITY_DN3493_c0_g1_i1:321-1070(+)
MPMVSAEMPPPPPPPPPPLGVTRFGMDGGGGPDTGAVNGGVAGPGRPMSLLEEAAEQDPMRVAILALNHATKEGLRLPDGAIPIDLWPQGLVYVYENRFRFHPSGQLIPIPEHPTSRCPLMRGRRRRRSWRKPTATATAGYSRKKSKHSGRMSSSGHYYYSSSSNINTTNNNINPTNLGCRTANPYPCRCKSTSSSRQANSKHNNSNIICGSCSITKKGWLRTGQGWEASPACHPILHQALWAAASAVG